MDPKKIKNKLAIDLSDQIPELIKDINDFSLKRLTSKKNMVFELNFKKKPKLFPKEVILKLYRTNYAEKEYDALIKLGKQNLAVPEVLFFKKPYIILKKIKGVNLCDFINQNLINITSLDKLDSDIYNKIILSVKKLAEWVARLHKKNIVNNKDLTEIIVFNKGDTRLRDFLFSSKLIVYGLDFEESYEGNYINDLAWICCSLIDTNPGIFQMPEPIPKIELINIFLESYFNINDNFHFTFNYFAERLIEFLNIVIKRRGLNSLFRKNVILKNISKDL